MPRKLKVVELYAGTGRSMEPFREWKRCAPALLADVDEYASAVYRTNVPKARYALLDLAKATPQTVSNLAGGRVDILLGCPPCQGYSDNGHRISDDPRNAHIDRFAEFVRTLRPMAIALENVPLAAGSDRFHRFVAATERAGYSWTAMIANALLWGSCQSRQRLLYVAVRNDAGPPPKFPDPTHGGSDESYFNYSTQKLCRIRDDLPAMLGVTPGTRQVKDHVHIECGSRLGPRPSPTIGPVLEGLPSAKSKAGAEINHVMWSHSPGVLKRMESVAEGGRWTNGKEYYSQTYGRLHRLGLSRTVTRYFANPGSGRYWHPSENRSLTLREAARIQGFPDSFRFLGHGRFDSSLVGNALDAALAQVSFEAIRSSLD